MEFRNTISVKELLGDPVTMNQLTLFMFLFLHILKRSLNCKGTVGAYTETSFPIRLGP